MIDTIDWQRMAAPQPDQYDAEMVLKMAAKRPFHQPTIPTDAPRIFDGHVSTGYLRQQPLGDRYLDAPLMDDIITAGVDYVRCWPEVYALFQRIMTVVHPLHDTMVSPGAMGSSSHADEHLFGTMYATTYNAHGLAQAFVHEMAHNKLRGLGILFEEADHLIINPPTDLFDSPIRKDRKRPMTAVFHAQYSFMHVTALNIANINAATNRHEKRIWLIFLSRNLPRMEEGYQEIQRHIKLDRHGQSFVDAFFAWSDEVLAQGNALLQENAELLVRKK